MAIKTSIAACLLSTALAAGMFLFRVAGKESPPSAEQPVAQIAQTKSSLSEFVPPIDLGDPLVDDGLDAALRRSSARSEPHGHEICASGCAVSHHPTARLTRGRCRELLEQYQAAPHDRESRPLDALLYFGVQTERLLAEPELAALLDGRHAEFLRRELSRSRAIVSIRLVDESGIVRAALPPTDVPQHVRQVFDLQVTDIQPLICSGTVKRVGLNHVWQRL